MHDFWPADLRISRETWASFFWSVWLLHPSYTHVKTCRLSRAATSGVCQMPSNINKAAALTWQALASGSPVLAQIFPTCGRLFEHYMMIHRISTHLMWLAHSSPFHHDSSKQMQNLPIFPETKLSWVKNKALKASRSDGSTSLALQTVHTDHAVLRSQVLFAHMTFKRIWMNQGPPPGIWAIVVTEWTD